MSNKEKTPAGKNTTARADLQLAFDVGHSSLGWAVLQTAEDNQPFKINLLGCGAVTFPNDDCLASKRRQFRSLRRHARSTRLRIERIAKLLLCLLQDDADPGAKALLTEIGTYKDRSPQQRAKLQGKGNAVPWLFAARVLSASRASASDSANLSWSELWHVLRWYAHNRGYDHETWGEAADDALTESERGAKQKDTEKVERAKALMEELGTDTMAETIFKYLFKRFAADDPTKVETLPFFKDYFKGENCAFERHVVRDEVRRILECQRSLFERAGLNADALIAALLDDWRAADRVKPETLVCGKRGEKNRIWIARRYGKRQPDGSLVNGGLLFGRLSARFLNRIISDCPLTGEKVPNKHCLEFFEFRWAEQVAKIQIDAPVPAGDEAQFPGYKLGEMRCLSSSERRVLDTLARARGFLRYKAPKPDKKTGMPKGGVNDLAEILQDTTSCKRSNLEKILLVPDIEQALRILPIAEGAEARTAFQAAWGCFAGPAHDKDGLYRDDPLRHRFTIQLLRGKELSAAEMIAALQKLNRTELAEKIRAAVRAKADKKGRVDEEKVTALLVAKFRCEKIAGRAPYCRPKLREAVQQVFHSTRPLHPLETGGVLCVDDRERSRRDDLLQRRQEAELTIQAEIAAKAKLVGKTGRRWANWRQNERAKLRKAQTGFASPPGIADESNNHLVRQRLHILERLFKELIGAKEFADANPLRVERITIEVARDLQTMSGMTSKEKARELGAKHDHFDKVSKKVAEAIAAENEERVAAGQQPIPMSYNLIRKCRIADDLGWDAAAKSWPCPYTLRRFTVADLVHGRYDKDHIIPRSKRLSDALEAIVITSRGINAEKDQRTALQFIMEMSRPENDEKRKRLGIRTEGDFRTFVESLPPKFDPFAAARAGRDVSDDEKRRWRRKQFLLTEKWEDDDFTPGDLTKTTQIMKLARQRLEAQYKQYKHIPVEKRPVILNIPGSVTAAFRDKSWKLLTELAAVHPEVKKAHEEGEKARAGGRDFNFKKTVRSITRLHHAVDATAIGLIADYLIPRGSAALNDVLARLIIKGKLTAQEKRDFEALRHQHGLSKFYRWSSGRFDDAQANQIGNSEGARLCINELPANLKAQLRLRLMERRVAQHMPADMSGLGRRLTQNTSGILSVRDEKGEALWRRGQNTDEELRALAVRGDLELELTAPVEPEEGEAGVVAKTAKPVIKPVNQVLGFAPVRGVGKLTPMRGVRIIRDNYGLAVLDHAAPGVDKFIIIPQRKVWSQIFDQENGFVARNGGQRPRILRNGMLIRLKNTKSDKAGRTRDGIWMIRSVKATLTLDLTYADAPDVKDSGYGVWREVSVASLGPQNIEILAKSLIGVAHKAVSCPTTSSA